MADWKIELADWKTANKDSLQLLFDRARERLVHTDAISQRITERAFTFINILIPLLALLLGLLAGVIPSGEQGVFKQLSLMGYLVFLPLIYCLGVLIWLVRPNDHYPPGRNPREAFTPELFAGGGLAEGEHYKAMLLAASENLQKEIEYNEAKNKQRIEWLSIVLYVVSGWLVLCLLLLLVRGAV